MTLAELVGLLELDVITGRDHLDREIAGGYVSDLLSDVMGNAPEGAVWVTLQTHENVVAVALLRSLAAVLLIGGRRLQPEVAKKADEEKVVFLGSKRPAFNIVGEMYKAGITGGLE
ncbi:MAG TPA: serine kinase [Acidobacteriota bacterium]|nr:serine kinase [Acidobacteriota bacterium]